MRINSNKLNKGAAFDDMTELSKLAWWRDGIIIYSVGLGGRGGAELRKHFSPTGRCSSLFSMTIH